MKTIRQALIDEIHFPLDYDGMKFYENKLIMRGLSGDDEFTTEVGRSNEWIGAVADCLSSIIVAPNFNEADKSVYMYESEKELIVKRANKLYASIGEYDNMIDEPMVYINDF